jgi:hypothetical protein
MTQLRKDKSQGHLRVPGFFYVLVKDFFTTQTKGVIMTFIDIQEQTLSDGSKVHNVIMEQEGNTIVIPVESEDRAATVATDLHTMLKNRTLESVELIVI